LIRSCLSCFMVSHAHCFICSSILPELVYLPKVDAPDKQESNAAV
jgi:hypothetical protein